jgi:hypothetical protein
MQLLLTGRRRLLMRRRMPMTMQGLVFRGGDWCGVQMRGSSLLVWRTMTGLHLLLRTGTHLLMGSPLL